MNSALDDNLLSRGYVVESLQRLTMTTLAAEYAAAEELVFGYVPLAQKVFAAHGNDGFNRLVDLLGPLDATLEVVQPVESVVYPGPVYARTRLQVRELACCTLVSEAPVEVLGGADMYSFSGPSLVSQTYVRAHRITATHLAAPTVHAAGAVYADRLLAGEVVCQHLRARHARFEHGMFDQLDGDAVKCRTLVVKELSSGDLIIAAEFRTAGCAQFRRGRIGKLTAARLQAVNLGATRVLSQA